MLRLVMALFASVGLGAVLMLGERLWGPLGRLVRLALVGLAAMLVLTGLLIGTAGLWQDAGWAAVLGGLVVGLGAALAWGVRSARRQLSGIFHGVSVPRAGSLPDPRWLRLSRELGWTERQQARLARERIAGFLAERGSESLSSEHQSLIISLERRVPELIDTCLDRCRGARGEERQRYLGETLGRLRQIGEQAERARAEVRAADDQRLQVLHRYFDRQSDVTLRP